MESFKIHSPVPPAAQPPLHPASKYAGLVPSENIFKRWRAHVLNYCRCLFQRYLPVLAAKNVECSTLFLFLFIP